MHNTYKVASCIYIHCMYIFIMDTQLLNSSSHNKQVIYMKKN